jgi:hypothetical protein
MTRGIYTNKERDIAARSFQRDKAVGQRITESGKQEKRKGIFHHGGHGDHRDKKQTKEEAGEFLPVPPF